MSKPRPSAGCGRAWPATTGIQVSAPVPDRAFVADFRCPRCRLVIEVDDEQHAQQGVIEIDQRRSALLPVNGYLVMRFWNHEVLADTDGVLQQILDCLVQRAST